MYETRLGLVKHRSPYDNPQDDTFAELNCSLEGQVAGIADRIAVNSHDLEDGMRAGLIRSEQLKNIEIFTEAQRLINAKAMKDPIVQKTRTTKAIIDILVSNCIDASQKTIACANLKTVDQAYRRSENLMPLPTENTANLSVLESAIRFSLRR